MQQTDKHEIKQRTIARISSKETYYSTSWHEG